MELTQLRIREHREFGRLFFEKEPLQLEEFRERMEGPGFLRETCDTPLLLTYAAMLHAGQGLGSIETIADFYGTVIRWILQGKWRADSAPLWAGSDTGLEGVIAHIAAIVWLLFREHPESNSFTHTDAAKYFKQVGQPPLMPIAGRRRDQPPTMEQISIETLLNDLVRVGLIVQAAPGKGGVASYSFAHRTFFEFLAAWHVHCDQKTVEPWPDCGKPPPDWKPNSDSKSLLDWVLTEKRPFHFRPEWLQCLTFLAALLGDASPLLEALDREPENIFRSIFGLQCHLISAAPRTPDAWAKKLAERWGNWRSRGPWEKSFERFWFTYAVALCRVPAARSGVLTGFATVLDPRQRVSVKQRLAAAKALGVLRVPWTCEILQTAADPEGKLESSVRVEATRALGALGLPEVRNFLERLLDETQEPDSGVRSEAIRALGELGMPEALPALAAVLQSHTYLAVDAASAMEEIGAAEARPHLEAVLTAPPSNIYNDRYTRSAAVRALGRLGAIEACHALKATMIGHPDGLLRLEALEALHESGVVLTFDDFKHFDPGYLIRYIITIISINNISWSGIIKDLKTTLGIPGKSREVVCTWQVAMGTSEAPYYCIQLTEKLIPTPNDLDTVISLGALAKLSHF